MTALGRLWWSFKGLQGLGGGGPQGHQSDGLGVALGNISRIPELTRESIYTAAYTQPQSGTHKGIVQSTTAILRDALGTLIIHSHFHKTKTLKTQVNNNRFGEIQDYDKPREGQGHTNTTLK